MALCGNAPPIDVKRGWMARARNRSPGVVVAAMNDGYTVRRSDTGRFVSPKPTNSAAMLGTTIIRTTPPMLSSVTINVTDLAPHLAMNTPSKKLVGTGTR
jgi:hypothetical protein